MRAKIFFKTLSIVSIVLGILLVVNSGIPMLGAVVGFEDISLATNLGFGVFFLVAGCLLFFIEKRETNKEDTKLQ